MDRMDTAGEEVHGETGCFLRRQKHSKADEDELGKVKMRTVEQRSISRGSFQRAQTVFCRLADIVLRTVPHDPEVADTHEKSTNQGQGLSIAL